MEFDSRLGVTKTLQIGTVTSCLARTLRKSCGDNPLPVMSQQIIVAFYFLCGFNLQLHILIMKIGLVLQTLTIVQR